MNIANIGSLAKILGELDLAAIQRESGRRLDLLVTGDEPARTMLTEALSREKGKKGTHPWLQQFPSDSATGPSSREPGAPGLASLDLGVYDLALIALAGPEPASEATAVLQRLHAAAVPAVSVVVGPEARERAGAALPRPLEQSRVLVDDLSPETVERELAPALLAAAPPELRLSLARHLPVLRPAHAQALIEDTARANAIYAASSGLASVVPVLNIPLGIADTVVLTKNQLVMAYKLALAGGKEGRPMDLMGEVAGVLGGGLLFRQVARELVGLLPVIGIVPNVAVAYAGTRVIGQAVLAWVASGARLEVSELRRGYQSALEVGREFARSWAARGRLGRSRRTHTAEPRALPEPEVASLEPDESERR